MPLKKTASVNTAEEKQAKVAEEVEVVEQVEEAVADAKPTKTKSEPKVIDHDEEAEDVIEADEPVAEKKTEVVEKTNNVPATKTQSTAVATQRDNVTSGAGSALKQAEEEGFEGLEVGYGTFPTIVIGTGGCFELDGDDVDYKTIVARLETSKALYLCVQEGVTDSPSAFTYDQVNLNTAENGCTTVDDLRKAWAEEGETLIIRKYLEVVCEIQQIDGSDDPEEHDLIGQFIICKIPPSSLNKFSGIVMMAKRRGLPANEIIVEFGLGSRREAKNGNKYTPWTFKQIK